MVAALDSSVRCMPLGRLAGVAAGDPVRAKGGTVLVPTGPGLFGRVIDGLGRPIDGKGPLASGPRVPIDNEAPNAMKRARIDTPLQTGVRVLDTHDHRSARASAWGSSPVPASASRPCCR